MLRAYYSYNETNEKVYERSIEKKKKKDPIEKYTDTPTFRQS